MRRDLAHADLVAHPAEHRPLVAGHQLAQEAGVLDRLPPPLDLAHGERDGSVGSTSRTRVMLVAITPGERRDVDAALPPRQPVAARDRLRHQLLQLRLLHLPRSLRVDVDHREGGRQRLRLARLPGLLVGHPGQRRDVGVARGVDDRLRRDPERPGLRLHDHAPDRGPLHHGAGDQRVVEQMDAGGEGEFVPEQLQHRRVVGDAGAGAVAVRPLERRRHARSASTRPPTGCRPRPGRSARPGCRSRRRCRAPGSRSRPGTRSARPARSRRPGGRRRSRRPCPPNPRRRPGRRPPRGAASPPARS